MLLLNMIKKWFNRTTPFVILSVIVLFGVLYMLLIERRALEGLGYALISRTLVFLAAIIVVDLSLKYMMPKTNYRIWVIELILCLSLLYYWIVA